MSKCYQVGKASVDSQYLMKLSQEEAVRQLTPELQATRMRLLFDRGSPTIPLPTPPSRRRR